MNGSSAVNKDVKWMKILSSKVTVMNTLVKAFYLLHGAEPFLRS
jgi:hypothetical protein